MAKRKLLITESLDFSPQAINHLKSRFEVIVKDIEDEEELLHYIKDVEVVFIRLKFKISDRVIDKANHLKYILTATTGLDHIDLDYFESKGGQIISLKGAYDFLATIPSTAEHTWGLMLALLRYIPLSYTSVKKGEWNRDCFKSHNLNSLKLGILGLGRVGKQVEIYAKAFGMETGYYDTDQAKKSDCSKQYESAVKLFEWADVISIHIPLNEINTCFVDEKLLSHIKSNAYLINTSRGAIVDEIAIEKLFRNGKLKGYATDVLTNEMHTDIKDNPIVNLANSNFNVIITPHIAGCTYESMQMTEDFITKSFLQKYRSYEKKA
ncbi:D-3-phosphoglycerate dehydrogenase [Winogradskyella psychrotolerans RS-3]|uniref:D-3-phosphoglycerate dehydrogenase n=1 Tax=Winogradskyella psychrotolerans RS-3 TaxID=641526 RepID=S7VX66_9FLAO|nr:2-hydroxyacid dehydrogenase [Winogradskyella psychrotolerans]EPR74691.1 D-3-phosphoglycerate dehydrogenase [Winogradskyella psychrotolerans RS-3]